MRVEEFVGQRIRDRREELGMTQEELGLRVAPLLGKAWSRQTVSAAEQGRRAFTAAELVAIARILETRAARLLTPPIAVEEVELPGGAKLGTRTMADFGVADKLLGDMYDDLSSILRGIKDARSADDQAIAAAKALEDKLTSVIAAAEMATMHSDRGEPALGEFTVNPPASPEGEQ